MRARLKGIVAAICVLGGIAVGTVAYWAFREWQVERSGFHSPEITGSLTFAPALVVGFAVAYSIGRWLARVRTGAWITGLASRHEVPRERLEEVARMVERL